MPEPINFAAAPVFERKNAIWVPAIAVITAPTVAELTAASSLDLTLIAFDGAFAEPTKNTERITGNRRWGAGTTPESRGPTTYTGGQVTAALNPQAAAASDPKKAWEKFKDPLSGFFVFRHNVPRATSPTAGQFVNVWPTSTDSGMPTAFGDGAAAEAAFVFDYFVTGTPAFVVAIAA